MKEFLDEYKHLEKLCNEIYGQNHGITQYINDMEQTFGSESRIIPGWDADLRQLKRLRHIRNAMVHDTTDYESDYTDEDIDYLREFYQRIMDGTDPLTQKRLNRELSWNSTKKIQNNQPVAFTYTASSWQYEPEEKEGLSWKAVAIAFLLAGGILIGIGLAIFL